MGMMESYMSPTMSEEERWKQVAKDAYIIDAHAYCFAFSAAGTASEHPVEEQFTSNPEDKKAVCEEVRYKDPFPRKTRRALNGDGDDSQDYQDPPPSGFAMEQPNDDYYGD